MRLSSPWLAVQEGPLFYETDHSFMIWVKQILQWAKLCICDWLIVDTNGTYVYNVCNCALQHSTKDVTMSIGFEKKLRVVYGCKISQAGNLTNSVS